MTFTLTRDDDVLFVCFTAFAFSPQKKKKEEEEEEEDRFSSSCPPETSSNDVGSLTSDLTLVDTVLWVRSSSPLQSTHQRLRGGEETRLKLLV